MGMSRWISWILLLAVFVSMPPKASATDHAVPILLYHRFGPASPDIWVVRTPVFLAQLDYLRSHGYHIVPLAQVVAYIRGIGPPPPPRSVVITADDGRRSVFRYLFPLARQYRFPVTLFIYPSAISNASYAMTWRELKVMKDSGLVDIQSHTYWHPNFNVEKKRLPPPAYEKFVAMQLNESKAKLDRELGIRVNMLAWPFGIYNNDLSKSAKAAGYVAAFKMVGGPAAPGDDVMALPRIVVTDRDTGKAFGRLLAGGKR